MSGEKEFVVMVWAMGVWFGSNNLLIAISVRKD